MRGAAKHPAHAAVLRQRRFAAISGGWLLLFAARPPIHARDR